MERSEEDARAEAEGLGNQLTASASERSRASHSFAIGGITAASGLAMIFLLGPAGVGVLVAGAVFIALGLATRRTFVFAAFGSAVAHQTDRGRFDVALALLDIAERQGGAKRLRQSALIQRGYIALALGDAKAARAHLDEALAVPAPRFRIAEAHVTHVLVARGLRGLAAALDGDHDTAIADADAAEAAVRERQFGRAVIVNESHVRSVLARAALTRAIVLSRSGGGEALAHHLAEHRDVLAEGTVPRERTLYRGLVRLARGRRSSAYREAPPAADAREAPTPEAWVERLAPDVGALLDSTPEKGAASTLDLDESALKSAAKPVRAPVRPGAPGMSRQVKVLLIWMAVATFFFFLWQWLEPSKTARRAPRIRVPAPEPSVWPTLLPALMPAVFVSVLVGLVAWRLRAFARQARLANELMCKLARGDVPPEVAREKPSKVLYASLMRSAALSRAAFADRRFEDALVHADAAFAAVARFPGRIAGEFHGMMSEARASALAALGRGDEARGEVGTWPLDYSRRTAGAIAVELVAAIREGDLDGAAAVAARANDEISIDVSTEALVDLLRARRGAIGLVDRERLSEDVREPRLRAFLQAVAPELLGDFERETGSEERGDGADDSEGESGNEDENEHEAERERQAEADADEPGASVRRVKARG